MTYCLCLASPYSNCQRSFISLRIVLSVSRFFMLSRFFFFFFSFFHPASSFFFFFLSFNQRDFYFYFSSLIIHLEGHDCQIYFFTFHKFSHLFFSQEQFSVAERIVIFRRV